MCGYCLTKPDLWVDIRDTAQVSTFNITYEKNPQTGEISEKPVVCVRHDGTDTAFLAQLSPEIDFKETYVGMPLKVKWCDEPEGNIGDIEYYEPLEDKAEDLRKED